MKLKTTKVIEDCKEWCACEEAIRWLQTVTKKEIEIADCPNKDWVAWYLYEAGHYWSEERFSKEITVALIETKNAWHLYLAGHYWSEERFSPEIANALIETKNAKYLYEAGRVWVDERFDEIIANALIETKDANYLYLAGRFWSNKRKKLLKIKK